MFLFFVCLIIPISFFFMYFFLKNKAYKKISRWSGFRTRLSMKNEKNWEIGNLYASKLSLIFGMISMAMTLFVFYKYDLNDKIVLILVGIQIVFLILISVFSEIKLYFVNKKGTVWSDYFIFKQSLFNFYFIFNSLYS